MMRVRDVSFKKYRRLKLDIDLVVYRLFRNKVSVRIKYVKESYSRLLFEENSGNFEFFWRFVKKIMSDAK